MEDFISLSDASTLTTDPTQKYQAKVKQVLNELSDNLLTKHEKFYLLVKHHQIQPNIILTMFHYKPTPRSLNFIVMCNIQKICKYSYVAYLL